MTPGQAIAGAIKRASESHSRLVNVNRNSLTSTSAKQREQRAKSEADALEYVKALERTREQVMALTALASKAVDSDGGTRYEHEEDEVGSHACCLEIGYKDHAPDCWVPQLKAAIDALGVL